MSVVGNVLTLLLVGGGLFFMLLAALGLLRMPDLFTRMHAATKSATLGVSGIALAALVYFGDFAVTTRVGLIILFFFLTAPVGAHALARAAYTCEIELCPETQRFDLAQARILCPARGGLTSQVLYQKAIALARESMGELTFLYVISHELLKSVDGEGEVNRMRAELETLGQSIVSAAQAQAAAQGLVAHAEVRVGEPRKEIVRLAQEMKASLVVLGYPEMDQVAEQHAAEDNLWALAQDLQLKTDAQVVVAR
jgi:multicomponent Na+:H+ antiporter subunit G